MSHAGGPAAVPVPGWGEQLDIRDGMDVLAKSESATLAQIRGLFREALAEEKEFAPLEGFKLNLSGTPDFHKLFFATRCSCKTVGLLSIEVARSKTLDEVKRAMPELVKRLGAQARAFRAMPCEVYTRMRLGGRMPVQP